MYVHVGAGRSMCVCVCVCGVHACVFVMHVCICLWVLACFLYTCVLTLVCVCQCIDVCVSVHICVCGCIDVCVSACVCVCDKWVGGYECECALYTCVLTLVCTLAVPPMQLVFAPVPLQCPSPWLLLFKLQGNYTGHITATDQNKKELACINLKLTL